MNVLLTWSALSLFLSGFLWGVMHLASEKQKTELEKMSPFECGFLSFEESRVSFSIHFILVGLIFLIFDIELVLLFPFLTSALLNVYIVKTLSFVVFLFLLSLGLFLEWEKSMLDWTN